MYQYIVTASAPAQHGLPPRTIDALVKANNAQEAIDEVCKRERLTADKVLEVRRRA